MKKLMLGLMLVVSGLVYAKPESVIFPRVYNLGNYVQVQIWNHTNERSTCSGRVYMYLENGRQDSESFFDTVMPGQTAYRTIRPMHYGVRVRSVSHTISCF